MAVVGKKRDHQSSIPLIEIIPSGLVVNLIKHGFGTEPARPRCSHSLIRVCRVLLVDLDGLVPSSSRRGIGKELRAAAFLHADEPKDRFLDRLADGE